jgi:phosphate transport system protein
MNRNIDNSLNELKQKLLSMAGLVEKAIHSAIEVVLTRSLEKTKEVYAIEEKVNQQNKIIDDVCFKILATQQPMASDLRVILSAVKINTDLERMVDQAVNISNNAEYYLLNPQATPLEDISQMSTEVKVMVRKSIDAFIQNDEYLARETMAQDDKVDRFKNKIFEDCLEKMKKDPNSIQQCLNIILIARNLERIGDHATNIAEDVVFTISGLDIRHSPQSTKP